MKEGTTTDTATKSMPGEESAAAPAAENATGGIRSKLGRILSEENASCAAPSLCLAQCFLCYHTKNLFHPPFQGVQSAGNAQLVSFLYDAASAGDELGA